MPLAENLQYLRKRDKITQEELADKLQVSRQSVSKWETGEAYPETEKIIALCDIFGVTMDDLMRGDVSGSCDSSAHMPAPIRENAYNDAKERGNGNDIPPADGAAREKERARMKAINEAICGGVFGCAAIAYLCMGFILNLWHPGWLVFLLAFSVCAFSDEVFSAPKKKKQRQLVSRIFRGLCGMTMMLGVTGYLFIGCVYGIWHPSWVIFIAAFVLMGVFDAISLHADAKQNK